MKKMEIGEKAIIKMKHALGCDSMHVEKGIQEYHRGQQAADGRQNVVVYDVMGRVIKQTADSDHQAVVEIPVTSAGVYMVKVGEHPSRKVVVR